MSLIRESRFDELFNMVISWGISALSKLVITLILFFIGRFFIKRLGRLITKFFDKTEWDESLEKFIESLIVTILYISLITVIISIVGKNTVSLAAILGAGGLAIGMAVKDNLANFAGGIMLLVVRPFKTEDFIEVQEKSGNVKNIGLFYTEIVSFDGKRIFLPNGTLSTGNIINYSAEKIRRLELVIGIEYGSNIKEVKKILTEIATNHPNILSEPEPIIILKELNSSSIDFSLRVFTYNEDYWDVKFKLNEIIYEKLNNKGIGIPFPQMTIHMADSTK